MNNTVIAHHDRINHSRNSQLFENYLDNLTVGRTRNHSFPVEHSNDSANSPLDCDFVDVVVYLKNLVCFCKESES